MNRRRTPCNIFRAPQRGLPALACLALTAGLAWSATTPPNSMRNLVLHAGHHNVQTMQIDQTEFSYLAPFSRLPFLMWPTAEAAPFTHDPAVVKTWLEKHASALGLADLQPIWVGEKDWRGNEVWSFTFEHKGIAVRDAHIDVHWREGRFVGLLNNLPGPVLHFENELEARSVDPSQRIWFPTPRGVGWRDGANLVLARIETKELGNTRRTRYLHPEGGVLVTSIETLNPKGRPFSWTEYAMPSGTFPDQIETDNAGKLWISQPLNDQISIFDPVSETFDRIVTGNDDPDGLIVDRNDLCWTGLYSSGKGLGRVDVATQAYTVTPPPYGGALMAIPFRNCRGNIWVSDHQLNRMSEFDPSSMTWLSNHVMPTASCWVVDTTEDPRSEMLYFTEYNVNQLGAKAPGQAIFDIPVSSGGPSFHSFSHGKVYYSLWIRSVLGAYDVNTGINTEYVHPVPNEYGGPLDHMSNGDIAVGSRNSGYVFVLRVATGEFESYSIPTSYPGLKDGLHVDANDVIWITESGANKIAKLVIDPLEDVVMAVSGSCPGTVEVDVTGATPGGQVAVLFARGTGGREIPCGNHCGGKQLGLGAGTRLVRTAIADNQGMAHITGNAPAGACSGYLQVLDIESCVMSGVERMP